MKKNKRVRSLESTDFRQLAESLVWVVGPNAGDTGSVCSCSSPPIVEQASTNVRCPLGCPWACSRQLELFGVSGEGADAKQTYPRTCNTGVGRPVSAQGKQKANKILGPKKRAS